jgi:hypothetical protein
MFPSLNILQHYIEFDTHSIISLEKLFDVKSFGGSIVHLVCFQAMFLVSLGKFNFLSVVQIVTLSFLGCWALIVFTLVTHFQEDDHSILLDAHVEIDIFLF